MGIDVDIKTHSIKGTTHAIAYVRATGELSTDAWPRFLSDLADRGPGDLPSNFVIDSLTSNDMAGLESFRETVRLLTELAEPPIYISLATIDQLDIHRSTVLAGEARDSGLDLTIKTFSSVKAGEAWLIDQITNKHPG